MNLNAFTSSAIATGFRTQLIEKSIRIERLEVENAKLEAENERLRQALKEDMEAFEEIYYCGDDNEPCDSPGTVAIDRIEELKHLLPPPPEENHG